MRLVIDSPDRVQALVLLNTGAALMSLSPSGVSLDDPVVQDRLQTIERRLALIALAKEEGMAAAVKTTESEWREPPSPAEPEPLLHDFQRNRAHALSRLSMTELVRLAGGAIRNMQAQARVDLTDELHAIDCPTLILHGDTDTTVPLAYGEAIASAIANAEFEILNGEGHGLITKPRVQGMIRSWLDRVC